jgi:predicted nucleic acid-binding protein
MAELQRGSRLYIDTNIWIYYIEAHPEFVQQVRNFFVSVEAAAGTLVTNEITVAECLYKPSADNNLAAINAYSSLFDSGEIELIPLDGVLTRQAAMQGGKLGLKLIDAIHYISALSHGCDHFITSDTRFKSGPGMKVVTIQA